MRRLTLVVLGALLASFTVLVPGGSAGAQDDEFTINPDTGVPGDLVSTRVDPEAVQRDCLVSPEQLPEFFEDIVAAFEDGEFDGLEETVQIIFLGVAFVVTTNVGGAGEAFLGNLPWILTFVDLATQEPTGEMSSWDPETGVGQIEVPDLDVPPYLWAVAAVGVGPVFSEENLEAAIEAGIEELLDGGDPEDVFAAMAAEFVEPVCSWTHPFEVPRDWPAPDPMVEAFCAVLPELSALGEDVIELLGSIPEDEWGEEEHDQWVAAVEAWNRTAEMVELFERAFDLIETGDEARPETVAPQWEIATGGLRDAFTALEAIEFDLTSESGRLVAAELRAGALDDSPDPEGDAAIEVLTQWFVDNCIPAPEPVPTGAPPAPAAAPVTATPTFTG